MVVRIFEEKLCMNRNLEERRYERYIEIVYLYNFFIVFILFGKMFLKLGGMCDNCFLILMFRLLMILGRD